MSKVIKSKLPPANSAMPHADEIDMNLLVVLVADHVDTDVVRQLMMQQVMSGGANLGIRFPKATLLRSWHYGGERNKARVKAEDHYFDQPPQGVKRIYRCLEVDRRFNWLSDAGLMAIGSKVSASDVEGANGEWNIFCQSDVDFDEPDTIRALLNLRDRAKCSGNHVMVIAGGVEKPDNISQKLGPLCDEVVLAKYCAPDPDVHQAMELVVPDLRRSHQFGVGRAMASVIRTTENFMFRYEPFVHGGLVYRFAWRLSSAGRSLEDIGKVLNKNKSTIMRWLRNLPPTTPIKFGEAEINKTLAMIECLDSESEADDDELPRATAADRKSKGKVMPAEDDDELDLLDEDE